MKMMRYKAQDEGRGSRCGTYTVALVAEGTKWAKVIFIEAQELTLQAIPLRDVADWMHPLEGWTDKQTMKFFRARGKTFGATKGVRKYLYPKG